MFPYLSHMNREGKVTLHRASPKMLPACGRHDNPRALHPATEARYEHLKKTATLCPVCFP